MLSPMMIAGLFLVGMFLSAFFSGSETGLYRLSRVRLVLDGIDGDWIAQGLLWLANRPALFVATTLIGNNLANYLTSAAIVLGAEEFFGAKSFVAGLLAPVVFSPVIFVFGELLPKTLYYQAPNRLLRRGGALFFLAGIIFLPLSAIVWSLGWLVQSILGQTPLRVQPALARKELQELLREGHDVGILLPAQQRLASTLFSVATRPVSQLCTPISRIPQVRMGASIAEVQRLARRHRANLATIIEGRRRELVGYVRIIDLYLHQGKTIDTVRPLMRIRDQESHLVALLRMQTEKQDLAQVVDSQGRTIGLLTADELVDPLLRGN